MMRKILRTLLIGPLVLMLLIGAAWIFENFRGASEWTKAKERAARMGVSLDLKDYPSPDIEEDRLLNDPIFKAEWNGEIEPRLRRLYRMDLPTVNSRRIKGISRAKGKPVSYQQFFDAELSEEEAVEKFRQAIAPVSKRLTALSDSILAHPAQSLVTTEQLRHNEQLSSPILSVKHIANSFKGEADLAARQKNTALALRNHRVLHRLRENFEGPTFIQLLVGDAILLNNTSAIWEGIRQHAWTEEQLVTLSKLIPAETRFEVWEKFYPYNIAEETKLQIQFIENRDDLLAKYGYTGSDEETVTDQIRDWCHFEGPAGWQDWRKATILNQHLDVLAARERWNKPWLEEFNNVTVIDDDYEPSFHPLAQFRSETAGGIIRSISRNATQFRMIRLAIALEQHFLKTDFYPESLEELNLRFSIIDLMDPRQRPIQYERTDDGYFTICLPTDKEISRWRFSEEPRKIRKKKK
ncbi:MAG: hypothetical protein ACN4GG_05965 [Akkermansiaceae bacterium]